MAYNDPYFGETTELAATWSESKNTAFTISSVTFTCYKLEDDSVIVRNAVAASVDDKKTYYIETFASTAYTVNTEYVGIFTATIVCGGKTYIEKHVDTFRVKKA